MDRIVMPLSVAKEMALMLLPHISTDGVTPVLTGAYIDGQYAYATDRYTVGRYDLTSLLGEGRSETPIWIPREALAILRTIGKASLRWGNRMDSYHAIFETVKESGSTAYTTLEIEWRPVSGHPEVHWMRVFNANGATGNYPPVARLIDGFIPGEQMRVGLTPHHVAKFTSTQGRNPQPMRVTMSNAPATNKKSGGPILIEVGLRFKGLIQPSIILDGFGYGADIAMDNLKAAADQPKPESKEDGE